MRTMEAPLRCTEVSGFTVWGLGFLALGQGLTCSALGHTREQEWAVHGRTWRILAIPVKSLINQCSCTKETGKVNLYKESAGVI